MTPKYTTTALYDNEDNSVHNLRFKGDLYSCGMVYVFPITRKRVGQI